jgi:hypothetical protein
MQSSGALLALLVVGCAFPEIECGFARVGDPEPAAEAGSCKKLTTTGDSRVTKEDGDGCSATLSTCVVLMPGESAVGWLEIDSTEAAHAERESAKLTTAGACPLTCE